jgi:hypothetical protein
VTGTLADEAIHAFIIYMTETVNSLKSKLICFTTIKGTEGLQNGYMGQDNYTFNFYLYLQWLSIITFSSK